HHARVRSAVAAAPPPDAPAAPLGARRPARDRAARLDVRLPGAAPAAPRGPPRRSPAVGAGPAAAVPRPARPAPAPPGVLCRAAGADRAGRAARRAPRRVRLPRSDRLRLPPVNKGGERRKNTAGPGGRPGPAVFFLRDLGEPDTAARSSQSVYTEHQTTTD